MRKRPAILLWAAFLAFLSLYSTGAGCRRANELAKHIRPFMQCINGSATHFALRAEVRITSEDQDAVEITATLERRGDETFRLAVEHADYGFELLRDAERTALILPKHDKVFVANGPLTGDDILKPQGCLDRLVSEDCDAAGPLRILSGSGATSAAIVLTQFLGLAPGDDGDVWSTERWEDVEVTVDEEKTALEVHGKGLEIRLTRLEPPAEPQAITLPIGYEEVPVDRVEMERMVVRGLRRGFEILAPAKSLTDPERKGRRVRHGELRWVGGERLIVLSGTPEEVGRAHGELLAEEVRRTVDSTIHVVGLGYTIMQGRWFPWDIRAAFRRTLPYIPEDHLAENDALADAAGLDREMVQLANVFPEMFHCSGFAVFGAATKDGKLYHGRVLDYMRHIGLQDCAGTFVVKVDGKIPFVNIGYAGFTGSVSGMNAARVSVGEMGGRGEGHWDGVPMATLMRRGLEECRTLDELMDLFQENPRTCEYYYVFADAKGPRAVGVAATPDAITFLAPGQDHELLGEIQDDTVLMSAGERIRLLRERVKEGYGAIDAEAALHLMDRPVSMSSNLHDVLFVPEDLAIYVVNADHDKPAAERPYTRIDLAELLEFGD